MTPRILYLHGFASGPGSKKAQYFAARFAAAGVPVSIPDLAEGAFEQLSISGQLAVVAREAAGGPVSLIGSSLGGYLAALYAARHPEVHKVVLLAPAFGFPRRWPERLGPQTMADWERTGWLPVFHYGDRQERRVGYHLIADGRLYEDFPAVHQPCLVFHGRHDDVVRAEWSEQFAATRPNVELHIEDSGHELLDVLEPMWERTRAFLLDGTDA